MASVTFDAQSFLIDSRRVWIVAGSVPYARLARSTWADRLAQARQAGLNTVETPVIWSRHEPRPGQFDFEGENDLRAFVKLVHAAGLHLILRVGPYIGSGYDLGGLPPWLLEVPSIELRTKNGPFLEACSRYLTAVTAQIRDLQVTSPGEGGPLLLVQNEHDWTCGDDNLAQAYLGELARYHREAGLNVPTINANGLWQGMEGEVDCWSGSAQMLSNLRQLQTVRPDQPRLVVPFRVGQQRAWGRVPSPEDEPAPAVVARRLVEVLAAGGQFVIDPFIGGTNFGHSGGRDHHDADRFATASADANAPVDEFGQRTEGYHLVRRVCTFASSFARVFSHLDSRRQHVAALPQPDEGEAVKGAGGVSVVHVSGQQGGVAFVFASTSNSRGRVAATLLLPEGLTLPVTLGASPAAWCLIDTRLTSRAELDYCSLSALTIVGHVFVCFGTAGAQGVLSINGSPLEVEVPKGKSPLIIEHEGITVVVASEEQTDTIWADAHQVCIGVDGLDSAGKPIIASGSRQYTVISADGKVTTSRAGAGTASASPSGAAAKSSASLALSEWTVASTEPYVTGESERFAAITGPASLPKLGFAYGYGWYRVRFKSNAVKRERVMFPTAGDRLHLFLDGEPVGVVGHGPGAEREAVLPLKKRTHTLVVLADNLGRYDGGTEWMHEPTGVQSALFAVKPIKAGKPTIVTEKPQDVLGYRSPLWRVHAGDATDANRLTWSFIHRRRTPIFMTLGGFEGRGLVFLNGDPVAYFERGVGSAAGAPLVFDNEALKAGKNIFQIALLSTFDSPGGSTTSRAAELASAVNFIEGESEITANGEWAFAKWEPPTPDAFVKALKKDVSASASANSGIPTWWRATFDSSAVAETDALALEPGSLSKGFLDVNSRAVGRFFAHTADGKPVGPQDRYHIPGGWATPTRGGDAATLTVFDEHGAAPGKARILRVR